MTWQRIKEDWGIAVLLAIICILLLAISCQKQPVQQSTPSAPSLSTNQQGNVQLNSPQTVPQQHTVALSWTWNNSFKNFRVYRSKTSGSGYVLRGTVVKDSYTDTVQNATSGEVFYYVVTAVQSINGQNVETPYSNQQPAVMP